MENSDAKTNTLFSPRQCAAELLRSVLDEKRPLDEALARHEAFASLPDRDRAFTRLMVMTALRRLGQIDAILSQMLEKPLTGRTQDVMHCLRLGVTQLIWLETPAHAAVHAMVETVAAMGHERMKGVANAVLKRVSREGAAIAAAQDEAALNLPQWLYGSWRQAYGDETAHRIALLRLAEPPLDLTVKEDAEGWMRKLGGAHLTHTNTVRLTQAGRVDKLEGYGVGAWWVQDVAASLPVRLLGDVKGLEVLDLCAAPGGKTAQLAHAGARVTAVDKSARRLRLLAQNLERLKLHAEMAEADILRYNPGRQFDAVLLDAPCSATGTLRRHPEVVWNKSRADIDELAALQKKLLNRVSGWVKPAGLLLYCVCSLQPEEGEAQAENFTKNHPGFIREPAHGQMKIMGLTGPDGALRTHPGNRYRDMGGMDGFYAVCWRRT